MLVFDTICALSTPPYRSALAIIRLSGEKSLSILSHIITKNINELVPNQSFFAKLYRDKDNKKEIIDEAMVTYYKGPKSYTGFDSVDFSIHGSMIVAEELINVLVSYGARRAEKGEFSAQAYFNGKMDLLKAEGINDLINARSKRAKTIATQTLSGKNTHFITELKNSLLEHMSSMEYFIENQYDEEQVDDYSDVLNNISQNLTATVKTLDDVIEKTVNNNKQYNGFNIVIAGEPNVGKSTLLNNLLKEDKAIVSPVPGTTRDVVEGEKEIDGLLFRFKDTAGLRKTSDLVENMGIERSYKTMEQADLILLTSDCGFNDILNNNDVQKIISKKPYIKVATKKDLCKNQDGADIAICSITDDLSALITIIKEKLNLSSKDDACFLGKREENYLIQIRNQIQSTISTIDSTHQIDISSDTLRVAITYINELMGNSKATTMEDIYQTLFSKFCLGK